MPTIPPHDRLPTSNARVLKDRAYAAWQAARLRSALLPVTIDKLWAQGLLATRQAPPKVQAVMHYRSELLFRLLADRACWDRDPATSPSGDTSGDTSGARRTEAPPQLRPGARHHGKPPV
jgi:hypothetical protein